MMVNFLIKYKWNLWVILWNIYDCSDYVVDYGDGIKGIEVESVKGFGYKMIWK